MGLCSIQNEGFDAGVYDAIHNPTAHGGIVMSVNVPAACPNPRAGSTWNYYNEGIGEYFVYCSCATCGRAFSGSSGPYAPVYDNVIREANSAHNTPSGITYNNATVYGVS